jgi:hypothetical protein
VNESYDEFVFWEPTEEFYNRVKASPTKGKMIEPPDTGLPVYNEQNELNNLLAARHRVAEEKARVLAKAR